MIDSFLQDFRYSLRQLRKSPGFAVVAVLTLALGIGATTAIFSLADAVLLRPLQFANQDRLTQVYEDASKIGFAKNTPAPGNFHSWKERSHTFEDMAATRNASYNLSGDGTPEKLDGTRITGNLFPMLGVAPSLGRNFLPEEDKPGAEKVVIISAAIWQQRFGSDPNVIGRTISMNYEPYRIIGVMPRGFTFPEHSQLWVPMALSTADLQTYGSHYLHVYGLIKNGVSLEAANADLKSIAQQLQREYPDTNLNVGAFASPLRDEFVGDLKLMLTLLLAGVGCLLLIACGNVAGLMMARAAARNREIAVRAALGATRSRLIRQSIAESILLAVAGAMLGILLTVAVLPFLSNLVPVAMAAWTKPVVDWRVAIFASVVCISSAVLFGLLGFAPVRINLQAALQQGGRGVQGTRHPLRRILVSAQIALALPLLVASCLMVQTVWKLSHADLGFDASHVITMRTPLSTTPNSPYKSELARDRFYSEVVRRVEQLPGVVSAGFSTYLPFTNYGGTSSFRIEGAPPLKQGEMNDANVRLTTPEFLKTMGMHLRAGRFLTAGDDEHAAKVAVVNLAWARKFLNVTDPLGHRFAFNDDDPKAQPIWFTIVGVVDDVRQGGFSHDPRPEMYFNHPQMMADFGDFYIPRDLAVRVQGDPASMAETIQKAIWQIDPQQPVSNVQPMQKWVDDELAPRDIQLKLFASFAMVSLLLSAIGLYGLLSFTVAQRTQETGVRLALGAQAKDILRLYFGEGGRIVLAGGLVGVVASFITQRIMSSALFGVSGGGLALTAGVIAMVLTALLATYIPASRAASTEPMRALRNE
ncbi:MAG TPA: ABC transporter permease [Terriglobales bacterium]|nr:ABC transporter permease [Terriglobales bacterium]